MVLCLTIRRCLSLLKFQRHQTIFANTTEKVTTDSFYWTNRLIAALADAHFSSHLGDLDDYQETTMALGHEMIGRG